MVKEIFDHVLASGTVDVTSGVPRGSVLVCFISTVFFYRIAYKVVKHLYIMSFYMIIITVT